MDPKDSAQNPTPVMPNTVVPPPTDQTVSPTPPPSTGQTKTPVQSDPMPVTNPTPMTSTTSMESSQPVFNEPIQTPPPAPVIPTIISPMDSVTAAPTPSVVTPQPELPKPMTPVPETPIIVAPTDTPKSEFTSLETSIPTVQNGTPPPAQPTTPTGTPNNSTNQPSTHGSSKFLVFGFIIIIFVIITSAAGYFLGKQNKPFNINFLGQPPTPTIAIAPSPTASAMIEPTVPATSSSFLKRQIDQTTKFLTTKTYPSSVLAVPESSLIGMSCTKHYTKNGKIYTYHDDAMNKDIPLTDLQFLSDITTLSKTAPTMNAFQACNTSDGRTVIEYETPTDTAGAKHIVSVGITKTDGSLQTFTTINNPTTWFSCTTPIQLTKSDVLYYTCSDGDGPLTENSLYKISLPTKIATLVLTCSSDASATPAATLTCK